jgi:hypothetical protein
MASVPSARVQVRVHAEDGRRLTDVGIARRRLVFARAFLTASGGDAEEHSSPCSLLDHDVLEKIGFSLCELPESHMVIRFRPQTMILSLGITVGAMKELLYAEFEIAPDAQRLVHSGHVLGQDSAALADVLASTEDSLWLIPRDADEPVAEEAAEAEAERPQRWLEDETLRCSMFCLGADRLCETQEPGTIFAGLFQAFVNDSAWTLRAKDTDLAALARAARTLAADGAPFGTSARPDLDSEPHVTWFPEYGCALIAQIKRPGIVELQLVALDGWEASVHSGSEGRAHQSCAGRDAAKPLTVGTVELDTVSPGSARRDEWAELGTVERYQTFMKLTDKLLNAAKRRTGDKRSAAKNPQGNPKTPGLVQAVLIDAKKGLNQPKEPREGCTEPQDGFADVGRHTGGTARNTTWPLVRGVLQILLEEEEHSLYRHTMAQLQLWTVECWLLSLSPEDITTTHVNATMQMLKTVQEDGVPLADEHVDMAAFEARCAAVRFELECLVSERARVTASKFRLKLLDEDNLSGRNLNLSLPESPAVPIAGSDLDALRARAKANLGWMPRPLDNAASWTDAKAWLDGHSFKALKNDAPAALLALTSVEGFFYRRAESTCFSEEAAPVSKDEVGLIEDIVETYRLNMKELRRSPDGKRLLQVELHSRETLLVWVAFCLVHAATKCEHVLLRSQAVPLAADDMRHLVLSDRRATDAAIRVANYLRANAGGAPVFSLRENDETFDFAREFAAADSHMQEMWKLEHQQAEQREDVHWSAVLVKKAELDRLDAVLEEQQDELKKQKSTQSRNDYQSGLYEWSRNAAHTQATSEVIRLTSEVSRTKRQIKLNEQPPAHILQPLPDEVDLALPIIFFLTMPQHFQVLSRMSFTAQQMLVPSEDEIQLAGKDDIVIGIDLCIAKKAAPTAWRTYYSAISTARSRERGLVSTKVLLKSRGKAPEESHFPKNVRHFTNRAARQAVWHPDELKPMLEWNGGSFKLDARDIKTFNPFAISAEPRATVHKFTETLPEELCTMQWAMPQYGRRANEQPSDRGNLSIARQDHGADDGTRSRPTWLTRIAVCGTT